MGKIDEKETKKRIKKFLVIMDSMTNAELDGKVSLLDNA
jgi:signal recognition particle GTPase